LPAQIRQCHRHYTSLPGLIRTSWHHRNCVRESGNGNERHAPEKVRIEHDLVARDRSLPVGKSLLNVLKGFVLHRFKSATSTERLFIDKLGRALQGRLLTHNFRRLCTVAEVIRSDGLVRDPRLLDLKATFAVNRITAWIKEDTDLNRMLPALAAYLGQAGLGATATYMRLTPERFRRPLNILSPKTAGKHWRCLKELAAL
jgi:integrase/recombinase XerD